MRNDLSQLKVSSLGVALFAVCLAAGLVRGADPGSRPRRSPAVCSDCISCLPYGSRTLAVPAGHLLGGVLQPRRVVGGRQRVGVDEVGLDLAGTVLRLDALQSGERARAFR